MSVAPARIIREAMIGHPMVGDDPAAALRDLLARGRHRLDLPHSRLRHGLRPERGAAAVTKRSRN